MESGNPDASWICCGIVRPELAKDVENLNQYDTIGLSSSAGLYQMVKINGLPNYDNKTYTFDLDLDKGVFSILHEGTVVCECRKNIKGFTFYPYCILKYPDNKATLSF